MGADKKQSKRKKDGIFYTPAYITRYIVEQAVGGWLIDRKKEIGFDKLPELTDADYASIQPITKGKRKGSIDYNKTIEKHIKAWEAYKKILSGIKVLDPACGSGAFLNEVFDYLYREGQAVNSALMMLNGEQAQLFRWDTHILANNIYGVDINSESVEITKLSLWLKTANKGEKLTYLDNNIKCGNSLIDDPTIAGSLAFKWEDEFPSIMRAGGFDVVVGNPPYIPIEMLSDKDKEFFKARFDVLERKYDSSVIFILSGLNLINKAGFLSYISSVTWQTGENYSKLREWLIGCCGIRTIVNLPFDIFPDAYVETCVYTLSKQKLPFYKMFCFDKNDTAIRLDNTEYQEIPVSSIRPPEFKIILNSASNAIFDKIKNNPETIPLGEITRSTQGLSANRYDLAENPSAGSIRFFADGIINRYKTFPTRVLHTNLNDKGSLKGFYSAGEKLLIRRLINRQDRVMVAFTDEEMVFTKDTNPFIVTSDQYNPKYLLAILASKLISYLYVNGSSIATKDDFRQTTLAELRALPIKQMSPNKQRPFIEKADILLTKNRELYDLSSKFLALLKSELRLDAPSKKLEQWYDLDFSTFCQELAKKKINLTLGRKAEWMEHFENRKTIAAKLKATIDATDKDIDHLVYELYGLTPDEIAVVEA